MFTGIIEENGELASIVKTQTGRKITIQCEKVLEGTQLGDSIAVNGVCITVTDLKATSFSGDVMAVTLEKSNLGQLRPKDSVHLERALTLEKRLGGHMVSGHIDGVSTVLKVERARGQVLVTGEIPPGLEGYLIPQGSLALDGVSLTIARLGEKTFTVSLIPETLERSHFKDLRPGDSMNLECDLVGKYVERLLLTRDKKDVSFYERCGF